MTIDIDNGQLIIEEPGMIQELGKGMLEHRILTTNGEIVEVLLETGLNVVEDGKAIIIKKAGSDPIRYGKLEEMIGRYEDERGNPFVVGVEYIGSMIVGTANAGGINRRTPPPAVPPLRSDYEITQMPSVQPTISQPTQQANLPLVGEEDLGIGAMEEEGQGDFYLLLEGRIKEGNRLLTMQNPPLEKLKEIFDEMEEIVEGKKGGSNNFKQILEQTEEVMFNLAIKIDDIEEEQKKQDLQQRLEEARERNRIADQRLSQADQRLSQADQRLSQADQRLSQADQRLSQADQRLSQADQRLSQALQDLKRVMEEEKRTIGDLEFLRKMNNFDKRVGLVLTQALDLDIATATRQELKGVYDQFVGLERELLSMSNIPSYRVEPYTTQIGKTMSQINQAKALMVGFATNKGYILLSGIGPEYDIQVTQLPPRN